MVSDTYFPTDAECLLKSLLIIEMPKTFEEFGLRFLYPDNWQWVPEDDSNSATLQLPSGGFCSLLLNNSDQTNEQVVQAIATSLGAEYGQIESDPLDITQFFSNGLAVDLEFYYLDLLIISRVVVTQISGDRFVFQLQAESRDFEANQLVFDAIFKQLRDSSTADSES